MARREKEQPEREPDWSPGVDDSLLLRSAESLGRVIGTLQRELDKATMKLFKADGAVSGNGKGAAAKKPVKRVPARAAAKRVRATASKAKTVARKSSARKTGASKATAKKK
jgi:hypothetical protein